MGEVGKKVKKQGNAVFRTVGRYADAEDVFFGSYIVK